jgi:Fe-S-cluster containining protein
MLMGEDEVPEEYAIEDQWGSWVMLRLADGWCVALDRNTMQCTIYADRPLICRDFEMGAGDCLEERARWAAAQPGR